MKAVNVSVPSSSSVLQAPAASLLNRAVTPATIIKQVSTVYTTVTSTTTPQRPPVLQVPAAPMGRWVSSVSPD